MSSVFQPMAILLDDVLNPIVTRTKSYVRDTTDFINKINTIHCTNDNILLCTMDVASLYTSIPHDLGIDTVKRNIQELQLPTGVDSMLLQFLEWVLKKNYFVFENKYYEQSQGTSMGSNVAPAYANLFMARFEDEFVYTSTFWPSICTWLRYIDDLFFIWQDTEEKLQSFCEYLNTRLPTIKFTLEFDKTEIHFLDVKVEMDQKLKPWTTNPPIMAYKRPPNLRDRLVHAVQEPMKKQENRHVG
ncbi:uncharacterized protein LOC108704076 isoform X2 [Xenopus laevis]|uniref:Uncharacterized protein LOC108704076 isoform X2 n=1 Tax=Xenopus laevis TaxID=8355 RepID=A0A8J1L1W9_XENLA|nr:uncharacterized protein LOC121393270 isoform X2 [Xenopus laevis]XP_041423532.1 uncharacterized protein LOC108704076 isoform X2 [Xenopus laevis]